VWYSERPWVLRFSNPPFPPVPRRGNRGKRSLPKNNTQGPVRGTKTQR
jgi:hypothetical protein